MKTAMQTQIVVSHIRLASKENANALMVSSKTMLHTAHQKVSKSNKIQRNAFG